MSLALLIQAVGSTGFFASRAFLPAFATALLLRFGPDVPGIAGLGFLGHVQGVPTWFTRDESLIVLGLLSALELAALRWSDARDVLDQVHVYLKAGMAALTYLGVVKSSDLFLVNRVVPGSGFSEYLPALAVGTGAFVLGQVRGAVSGSLREADEDDDLGVRGLVRWAEDLWAGFGPAFLILLPALTIAALGLAVGLLGLIRWQVAAREDAARIACAQCGRPIHASALACPHCGGEVESPRAVGLLGRAKPEPAPVDLDAHAFALLAAKRCPVCASHLNGRSVALACDACGHRPFADPDFASRYVTAIDRRVPMVLLACFLMGLVPVVGLIPGVIFYRLAIVAPFRRYIPAGRGFVLKWVVRIASLGLVAFQWVPGLGGLTVPAMALINSRAYRSAFRDLGIPRP